MLTAVAASSSVQICGLFVLNLSVCLSVLKSLFIEDFIISLNLIKQSFHGAEFMKRNNEPKQLICCSI